MIIFKLILLMLFISIYQCRIPDKVLCANDQCNEPISKARTLLSYNSGDPDIISFPANVEATVLMKSAGTESDLWYASISGRTGFVPSKFLREQKIFVKNPQSIKPVQVKRKSPVPDLQPDKVKQAHEIFEGTTIYTTESSAKVQHEQIPPTNTLPSINEIVKPVEEISEENSVIATEEINNNLNLDDINTSTQDKSLHDQNAGNGVEKTEIIENKDQSSDLNSIKDQPPLENQAQTIIPNDGKVESKKNYPSMQQDQPKDPALEMNNFQTDVKEVVQSLPGGLDIVPQPQVLESNSRLEINEAKQSTPNLILQKAQSLVSTSSGDVLVSESVMNLPENEKLVKEATPPNDIAVNEQNISSQSNVIQSKMNSDTVTNLPSETNKVPNPLKQITDNEQPILTQNQVPVLTKYDNGKVFNSDDSLKNINSEIINGQLEVIPPPKEPIIAMPSEELLAKNPKNQEPTQQSIKKESINAQSTTTPSSNPTTDVHNNIDTNSESASLLHGGEVFSTTESSINSNSQNSESIALNEDSLVTESPVKMEQITTTTESTITEDESSESLLSNMYSTLSGIWPSSTESPPTYDSVFNANTYDEQEPTDKLEDILEKIEEPENLDHIYHKDSTKQDEILESKPEEESSFLNYLTSLYFSVMGDREEIKDLFASPGETCYTHEYPRDVRQSANGRLLTFMLTSAATVLLFTLGYYYIEMRRQDGKFVGMVNSLQRDLLCSTKECEILKEELTTTKTKLAGIEDSSFGMDDMVQSLKEEINELKIQNERLRNSLDDNEKLLRVSENTAGELQNTLSEVENTLSELLGERAQSEDHIAELNGKIQAFEEELIAVSQERDAFQKKYASAEAALQDAKKLKSQLDELSKKLAEANNTIQLQKHQIVGLKDAIKDVKSGGSSNIDVSSLIDHTEIKAKLAKAVEEKDALEIKYKTENEELSRIKEELKTTQDALYTTSQQATEATTRLDVLEKYFQERESELVKELNSKEAIWLSKQGESASTVEKMELLQQEVQRYKEKCDTLALELAEQESAKRTALAELETRAHTAWLEARTAKREAAADKEAAAALRRKLASLTEGTASPQQRVASPLDATLEGAPVLPPLLPFLPPPILPPPRPPPLGRLPSPLPRYGDRRYSPDSRYSPESRYSPPRYLPERRYSESRYSPETVRYSPDSRYSPERRYSPRRRSRERYTKDGRSSQQRQRNGPMLETETEYGSDSPSHSPRRRRHYSGRSGPSSGSGCSSESDK